MFIHNITNLAVNKLSASDTLPLHTVVEVVHFLFISSKTGFITIEPFPSLVNPPLDNLSWPDVFFTSTVDNTGPRNLLHLSQTLLYCISYPTPPALQLPSADAHTVKYSGLCSFLLHGNVFSGCFTFSNNVADVWFQKFLYG